MQYTRVGETGLVVSRLAFGAMTVRSGNVPAVFAWLLHRKGVSSVLMGASKLRQLEDNLGAADVRLSDEEIKLLDEQSPHGTYYPSWFTTTFRDPMVDKALPRG